MLYPTMAEQFERRQKAWKPNMDIQLTPPYRVDSVLTEEYIPPNAENEITMACFNLLAWQSVVHNNESGCERLCGDVYCDPDPVTDFGTGKIYNVSGDEWCEDPLVPKDTYEQQSTVDYENAGVYADVCNNP